MNTKTKKVMNLIGSIFFFLIAGLLVLYILLEIFIPNTTIKVFQFKPYSVVSRSMEPVINKGDLVIVTNPNVDKLAVGDIITFRADIDYDGEKEIVTHYIKSKTLTEDGFIFTTNRYGSTTADTWGALSEDEVIGLYSFRIPKLGVFVDFIKSPFGIIAIIVNIGVIIGIVYIVKKSKKDKPQENKPEA